MRKQTPLSVLIVGFHAPSWKQLKKWTDQGLLSLVGIWLPETVPGWDGQTEEEPIFPSDAFLSVDEAHLPDTLARRPIDVIFLAEPYDIRHTVTRLLPWETALFVNRHTLWIVEALLENEQRLQQLLTSREELQTILTYSHEGVQLVDADGIIRYVNPAFTKITKIPAEERIGRSIFEVSPDGALAQTLRTKAPVLQWRNRVEGSGVEVISNAAPIYSEGKLTGAVTTFQNITELLDLSRKLQQRDKEIAQLHMQIRDAHPARFSFSDIVAESEAIQEVIHMAKTAAKTGSTVLITGESGTGKELFAHAIHQASERRLMPFVIVNCAAIPETLLESELFGHEKGAFTQATHMKRGKLELANGGTLFLDEIGDMSPPLQAKLLRFLQTRRFERIGGLHPIEVDVRIIAATNRKLEQLIATNTFREDLYYRLNVIRLEIPPLRKRLQDLAPLASVLMERIGRRIGVQTRGISNKAIAMLAEYHWPGNIRELENVLERLMNESQSGVIPDSLVLHHIRRLTCSQPVTEEAGLSDFREQVVTPLRLLEKRAILQALQYFGSTVEGKKRAASALGISLATLYNKLRDYQIPTEKEDSRAES